MAWIERNIAAGMKDSHLGECQRATFEKERRRKMSPVLIYKYKVGVGKCLFVFTLELKRLEVDCWQWRRRLQFRQAC
jgi:hypothetical protein